MATTGGRTGCGREDEVRQNFSYRYRPEALAAGLAAEREALDSDYGGNGYTTRAQADRLLQALRLARGTRLLEIGAGCGWPGLYLADRSGCELVVSDLTLPGMVTARVRARRDGLAERTSAVVATARQLPFRPDTFDAIVHTDVLC